MGAVREPPLLFYMSEGRRSGSPPPSRTLLRMRNFATMTRLGYCGDNCDECPRSAATVADSKKELHRVAKLWHRLRYRERTVTVEEIKCPGCTPKNACAYGIAACAGKNASRIAGSATNTPARRFCSALTKRKEAPGK